jgi:hypothetical protein
VHIHFESRHERVVYAVLKGKRQVCIVTHDNVWDFDPISRQVACASNEIDVDE